MSDVPAELPANSGGPAAGSGSRTSLIQTVTNPLGFFVLVVLIVEALLATILVLERAPNQEELLIRGMLLLIFVLVMLVAGMAVFRPAALYGLHGDMGGFARTREIAPGPPVDSEVVEQRLQASPQIAGEVAPPPPADVWEEDLRPVLHQANHFTVPTYYLDMNLRLIDWNLAFELVFSRCAGMLRGKHVKFFIAQLENFDEVIAHAQQFTRKVFKGNVPFVDIEPLRYVSEKYGRVSFVKVAVQLHDPEGRPRGWSVGLMIREINWDAFQNDLLELAQSDKLWSVYSAAYDHILCDFPPYRQLIDDVVAVVPRGTQSVVDLGAGTGNVTAKLLELGHRVTAVESNQGMLDRLRAKHGGRQVTIVKSSVETLGGLADESFDAVVMVNVLYAVSDPLSCLQEVHRILKPGGMVGLSTTHSEVELDTLLNSIKAHLHETGTFEERAGDYQIVRDLNKAIERGIARRHSREEYREWVEAAGFEITREIASTYEEAVMLIHARKR
jgi:ubiquinone/menaquinone biosynthesis C-methylase UbiE